MFSAAQQTFTYPGTVQARVEADLGFRIGGKLTERLINIGDHVRKDQILARLDPTDLKLTLQVDAETVRAAQADADDAQAEFARYQRLGRNSPAFIGSEFDRRRAAVVGAQARAALAQHQLALAFDQLSYTELHADADGVITDIHMEPGQVVTAGQTVAALAHSAATEIALDVPENRLWAVRNAQRIAIRLWAHPDLMLAGQVREIGGRADPASRTFSVRVTVIDPPPDTLALGMTASVAFSHDAGPPVALLPASAIVGQGNAPAVWVLDPAARRVSLRSVSISGWRGDDQVAVTAGITAGEQVVTAGASELDAGTPVFAWAGTER